MLFINSKKIKKNQNLKIVPKKNIFEIFSPFFSFLKNKQKNSRFSILIKYFHNEKFNFFIKKLPKLPIANLKEFPELLTTHY